MTETATDTLIRSVAAQTAQRQFTNVLLPADSNDEALDFGLETPFDAAQSSNALDGLAFTTTTLPGNSSVSVHHAKLGLRPTLDATFDNASRGIRFGLPTDATTTGVDADLFDGRLQVSSDVTLASDAKPLGLRPGEDLRSTDRVETAYRHSFNAQVVNRDRFKWSLAGQMGQIDPRFADFIFTQPGDKTPALHWSSMATRMDFGLASLSVGYDDVRRADQVESNRTVTFGFNQSALSVYRRDASQFSLDQGGHWLRRTAVTGASAEVIVADVLPNKLGEAVSPIRPFLPTTISASYEQGDALQPDGPDNGGPIEHVRSMSTDLSWDTRLGQTTVSLWQRDIKTNADDLTLERASDRVIDLAHSVRRGNWRFGAGVSLIQSEDTTPTTHSRESRVAPHISFAYSSEDFPTVEVRVGAADARTVVGVDDIPASAKARQLQISLDLSNFVQDQLSKPQAQLKLEYRRELENSDTKLGGRFAHQGDQALLLTFSTPLN
ncbi:MAG: hypothetical protein GC190_11350 [Alphaproteobacteria bacterium]|nr:hypothetical protein [Alphaproteobacteria bacterium]